ncbi:MAG: SNF2-related protein [Desulfobacteraceae bacterium]
MPARKTKRLWKFKKEQFDACVDLNPHQIEAALFALRSPLSKGVLLADEVGLGKTIEAGLVLCQSWAERKCRILVVCPASLRKQWAVELEEKFNLPSQILDAKTYRNLEKTGNPKNSLLELYGLSTLIDENIFGDLSSFRTQYINCGGVFGNG